MFRWQKLGRIFSPQTIGGRSWLSEYAQAPCSLVFDNFVRIYFSCRPPPDNRGQFTSYSAYADFDKSDLTKLIRVSDKPVLQLGDRGMFDEFGTYPISVIRSGQEIFAYYAGWTRCESVPFNVAIGFATSRDEGESFTKLGNGPILAYSPDEPFVISGPKVRRFGNSWYLWYIAGRKWIMADGRPEPVYKIRMATSADGLHWQKQNRDLIDSQLEADEAQASPDVLFANGKYHMFFCYRRSRNFRGKDGGYRIGYASSTNLLDWVRDDSRAGIDVSETGWDCEMVAYPHVFEVGATTYLSYLGNQVGRFGFGLAVLQGKLE